MTIFTLFLLVENGHMEGQMFNWPFSIPTSQATSFSLSSLYQLFLSWLTKTSIKMTSPRFPNRIPTFGSHSCWLPLFLCVLSSFIVSLKFYYFHLLFQYSYCCFCFNQVVKANVRPYRRFVDECRSNDSA